MEMLLLNCDTALKVRLARKHNVTHANTQSRMDSPKHAPIMIGMEAMLLSEEPTRFYKGRQVIKKYLRSWEDSCHKGNPPMGLFLQEITYTNAFGGADAINLLYRQPGRQAAVPMSCEFTTGLELNQDPGKTVAMMGAFLCSIHEVDYDEALDSIPDPAGNVPTPKTRPLKEQEEWTEVLNVTVPRHMDI